MAFNFKRQWPDHAPARIDGEEYSVPVRVHPRARHYRLSVGVDGLPVLTVPAHGRWSEAESFLARNAAWLEARLKRAPQRIPFAPGERVPLRGLPHRIEAAGGLRGRPMVLDQAPDPILSVPGDPQHLSRRLTDWLKTEAAGDLSERVAHHAARLGVSHKGIFLRAQATRWGSCASSGRLNFNWRLILAPPFVLDYVAAHEVAHLIEMNHSQNFWNQVERTLPDMARGRAWLKSHGRQLMAYGIS